MIDTSLLDELRESATRVGTVQECIGQEAADVVALVARRYDRSSEAVWWWEGLEAPHERVPYETGGLKHLVLARVSKNENAYLIVTDDEPGPWPVFSGSVDNLLNLVLDQRYFEYFLSAPDAAWLIFDTHHNEAIFVGNVASPMRARNEPPRR